MTDCKHDWHFTDDSTLRCIRCGAKTAPRTPGQLMQDLLSDVTLFGMAWRQNGERIDPNSVYSVPTETLGPYTIHGPTAPPNIHFYGGEDRTEILRLSKDGIWANPDVPCDEAAKKVLEAIDGYIKVMVEKAVTAAINEEIEACAAIAHEAEPYQAADLIRARKRT